MSLFHSVNKLNSQTPRGAATDPVCSVVWLDPWSLYVSYAPRRMLGGTVQSLGMLVLFLPVRNCDWGSDNSVRSNASESTPLSHEICLHSFPQAAEEPSGGRKRVPCLVRLLLPPIQALPLMRVWASPHNHRISALDF